MIVYDAATYWRVPPARDATRSLGEVLQSPGNHAWRRVGAGLGWQECDLSPEVR